MVLQRVYYKKVLMSEIIILNYFYAIKNKFLWIDFWEREREREIDPPVHPPMHSLAASCMYPDQESNLKPWCMGKTLQPTKPPGQAYFYAISNTNSIFTISEKEPPHNSRVT